MSSLRKQDRPVAVLCSDLHLSVRPPLARSEEHDWFAAMATSIAQVNALASKHHIPILCAGDVFDHWRSLPELINFALRHLPPMYSIPGQHDLPYHSFDAIDKSAYWTLVEGNTLVDLSNTYPRGVIVETWVDMVVYGFPFGAEIKPNPNRGRDGLSVAVIHEYTWKDGCGYVGAPEKQNLSAKWAVLQTYDVVVIGDNHQGFTSRQGKTTVFNCGSLMRRASDQAMYRPQIGLLHASGLVEPHYLDCSKDRLFKPKGGSKTETIDLSGLFGELNDLQAFVPDFADAVNRAMDETEVTKGVRRVVTEAITNEQS
jgi:hypothetical protein